MIYAIIILGVLALSPLAYIDGFLLIALPKKLGHVKFFLILLFYIIFVSVLVALLSFKYINFITFVIFLLLPYFFGVYLLRREFFDEVKRLFRVRGNH